MDTKIWTQESDNYTNRAIELHKGDIYKSLDRVKFSDTPFNIITKIINEPNSILDVGCSFGGSIYVLKDRFKSAFFCGIDPGKESIQIANKNLASKRISFTNGFSHNLPYEDNQFDIIIFSMVLQWIPRKHLIRTISEVDRVLQVGGVVYIQEFLPNKPIMSQSRHDEEIYIFKDNYPSFFTAYPWFKEVHKEVYEIENGESQQRHVSLIRKYDLAEVYELKKSAIERA